MILLLKSDLRSMICHSKKKVYTGNSPRARNRFNQVVEAERFEAEFKNQTLKKVGWYTKMLCTTEYPG